MRQEYIDLYDAYTHEHLDRRRFMRRMAELAGGTAAAAAIVAAIEANYAQAAMIAPNDERLAVERVTYPGAGGENISLGSATPMATHIAWYNSSGHHRNILGSGYAAMGSGKDGQHWTQNFGMAGTLER